MSKQLQDISFIFKEDQYTNSINCDISLLYSFLVQQLRKKQFHLKKQYSENFNLIQTLKHETITCPYDVKTNQQFIFIASTRKVTIFDRITRKYHSTIDLSTLTDCTTLCLDPNSENDLYISGSSHKFIHHYRYNKKLSTFEFVNQFNGPFSWITNIVIDNFYLYCVERCDYKIFILNKQNGQLVREINNNENIKEPWSMILCDKDHFLLASLTFKSIAKLSLLDGKLINSYVSDKQPTGMIVNDKTNHLLVCSYATNRLIILEYDTLKLVKELDLDVKGPMGIEIDCDGNLYISEYNAHCVKIFN